MRVNIYAEEMTDRVEIIAKEIDGHKFTGCRFYLELPAAYFVTPSGDIRPVQPHEFSSLPDGHFRGPFLHRPGDDDSSAVTFWGKRDLRESLRKALDALDQHYAERGQ